MNSVEMKCEHCGKRFKTEFETAEDLDQINADGWVCQHCGKAQKHRNGVNEVENENN